MELASKRITGFLYLDREGFLYFNTTDGSSFQYTYPVDAVHDLEIVNMEMLVSELTTFIQTNTVTPTHMAILLSPAILFEKTLPLQNENPQTTDTSDIIARFVDSVPFEAVSFIKFSTAQGINVIAANTDFFSSIKQVFEKQGFAITRVFPVVVFGEELSSGINIDIANRILNKIDDMKQYNLLQQQQVIFPSEKKVPSVVEKKSKNNLYILGGVFFVLVLILVGMLLFRK
jgi:hypothetical protein